ncbi:hypothetical protein TUM4644_23550 [Shewanella colwelliana]|uniref:hypothetical protein n=1 Tax=Shewanella colwelliana TaxID=23 RepID=UPI001BC774EE|nr:hypothetical protein [Shewanella colwelliana]GIU27015.1 hypothetical protein TUM4644_23550 [Shewanella colwelliana]
MIFKSFALSGSLALILIGCSSVQPKTANVEFTDAAALAGVAPTTTTAGRYIWGHEVAAFQPCDSQQVYWVRATPTTDHLNQLALTLSEQRSQPYQPIYVEAEIFPISRDNNPAFVDGFAADYDGIIEINSVTTIETKIPVNCHNIQATDNNSLT